MTHDLSSQPQHVRSAESVRRQCLWLDVDCAKEQVRLRLSALEEVLRRLPSAPYQALCRSALTLQWKVEGGWLGRVAFDHGGPVVELAERLEQEAWPIVVTVVAHELAHVMLRHVAHDDASVQRQQELEAANELRKWGFAAEADMAEFLLSHRAG
ncbi:MAG TPA: hypothetical protein VFB96_04375 [Pirellulaceae bacterium]|nr:hypothetical protein [Pirellulaceae bacterium]